MTERGAGIRRAVPLLLAAVLLAGVMRPAAPARADDPAATLYEPSILEYWGGRYAKSMQRILDEGFGPELTAEEYATARATRLSFPLRGQGLIGFYSAWPPPEIVLPVVSLKILDDLSIAFAWLQVRGHTLETVEEYVAMLRYKPRESFPGMRYPTPFQALGIPDDALADPAVDGLALRLFNEARAFVLAHELGHLHFRHQGGSGGTGSGGGAGSLLQEREADSFALDLMARSGTIPLGMILYFQAMTHWSPNRAQFDSDEAWEAFLETHRTHPVTAERIQAIARGLELRAEDFARLQPDRATGVEAVRFIAHGLMPLIAYLRDDELQRCVAETAFESELADLAPRPTGISRLACAD